MTRLHTEIDGMRFSLTLGSAGQPYVLKRYPDSRGHQRFGIVWAEWHKGLPTGMRRRAIEAMGFWWRSDTPETLGWHSNPKPFHAE